MLFMEKVFVLELVACTSPMAGHSSANKLNFVQVEQVHHIGLQGRG